MLQSVPREEAKKSATAAERPQSESEWDDGEHSGVRQIVLTYGAAIDSIRIEYDNQGSQVWSEEHGRTGGCKPKKVKLNYPEEYLASIHGYYGNLDNGGPLCVRSLTFQTNLKKYGPYGVEQGTYFSSPTNDPEIIGFHGRSGSYLYSIDAKMGERPIFSCPTTKEWEKRFKLEKNSQRLVVVHFTASWCSPCRFIVPVLHSFAKKMTQEVADPTPVLFLKVDVDKLSGVADEYKVEAMPTFLFMKGGREIDKVVGARKKDLLDTIKKHAPVTT